MAHPDKLHCVPLQSGLCGWLALNHFDTLCHGVVWCATAEDGPLDVEADFEAGAAAVAMASAIIDDDFEVRVCKACALKGMQQN